MLKHATVEGLARFSPIDVKGHEAAARGADHVEIGVTDMNVETLVGGEHFDWPA